MLAYKKDLKIINDSKPFSNAIRLIAFLITGKWAFFFTSVHFVSPIYDSEQNITTHFIRKSTNLALFLKNLVVPGSPLHEFEMFFGCVFHKSIYCIIFKKWRDYPEITKKLFFCFIFGLKICLVQKARCIRMPYRVDFIKSNERNTAKLFSIFKGF